MPTEISKNSTHNLSTSCASSSRLHPPSQLRSRHCPKTICYQMWTVKGTTNAV